MYRLTFAFWIAIQLPTASASAESWLKRVTPEATSDAMYSFTIKVEWLDAGDVLSLVAPETPAAREKPAAPEKAAPALLRYQVTVKPIATTEQLKESEKQGWRPQYAGRLRVMHGKEFISSCELQPTVNSWERTYTFEVAPKYAEKSHFHFTLTEGHGDSVIGYWFYLQDFVP